MKSKEDDMGVVLLLNLTTLKSVSSYLFSTQKKKMQPRDGETGRSPGLDR